VTVRSGCDFRSCQGECRDKPLKPLTDFLRYGPKAGKRQHGPRSWRRLEREDIPAAERFLAEGKQLRAPEVVVQAIERWIRRAA
jgi:hypothetical protein